MSVDYFNLTEIYEKYGADKEFYFYHFNDVGMHLPPNFVTPQVGKLIANADIPHASLPYYLVDGKGNKVITNPVIFMGVGYDLDAVTKEYLADVDKWHAELEKMYANRETIVGTMKNV
jgi:hypothetical protein